MVCTTECSPWKVKLLSPGSKIFAFGDRTNFISTLSPNVEHFVAIGRRHENIKLMICEHCSVDPCNDSVSRNLGMATPLPPDLSSDSLKKNLKKKLVNYRPIAA